MGNTGILDEVFAKAEQEKQEVFTYIYDCAPDYCASNVVSSGSENIISASEKRSAIKAVKEKISQIRNGIGLIVGKVFQKIKRVLL